MNRYSGIIAVLYPQRPRRYIMSNSDIDNMLISNQIGAHGKLSMSSYVIISLEHGRLMDSQGF
jgi:hypothetical protein